MLVECREIGPDLSHLESEEENLTSQGRRKFSTPCHKKVGIETPAEKLLSFDYAKEMEIGKNKTCLEDADADERELVYLKNTKRTKQTIISSLRPIPEFLPVDAKRMKKRLDTGGGERKKLFKRKLFSISRDYMVQGGGPYH